MDKLTQKHLEAIEHDDCWIANECTPPDFEVEIAAQKSAEITKEELIKFGVFIWDYRNNLKDDEDYKSLDELFEQYLNETEL